MPRKIKNLLKKLASSTKLPSSRPFVGIPAPITSLPNTGGGHNFGNIPVFPGPTTKSTQDRVASANSRATARMNDPAKTPRNPFEKQTMGSIHEFMDNQLKTTVFTPFGPINMSKFATKDPGAKITTVAKDYGKQPVGHKYSDFVRALKKSGASDAALAKGLLEASEGRLSPESKKLFGSGEQANAGAKMVAIPHISEQQRFPGSAKMYRGVLRIVETGEASLEDAFTGDNPLYPPAKSLAHTRKLFNLEKKKHRKPSPKPKKFDKIGEHMSDSSDEEG